MSEKKSFLLRLSPEIFKALEKWATDDLRSLNQQIEYLLREELKKAKRIKINNKEELDTKPSITSLAKEILDKNKNKDKKSS